jgi:Protein of unknown function (DUF2934)
VSDSHEDDRLQRIRHVAYGLWEKEGYPEDRHEEFWLRAEGIVDEEENLPHRPAEAATPEGGVDVDSEHSFPASDPPSFTPSTTGGKTNKAA